MYQRSAPLRFRKYPWFTLVSAPGSDPAEVCGFNWFYGFLNNKHRETAAPLPDQYVACVWRGDPRPHTLTHTGSISGFTLLFFKSVAELSRSSEPRVFPHLSPRLCLSGTFPVCRPASLALLYFCTLCCFAVIVPEVWGGGISASCGVLWFRLTCRCC